MAHVAGTLGLTTTVVALLAAAASLQFVLQVSCTADIWRRGEPAIVGKWVWTAVVVACGAFGSVLYLTMGRGLPRARAAAEIEAPAPTTGHVMDTVRPLRGRVVGPGGQAAA